MQKLTVLAAFAAAFLLAPQIGRADGLNDLGGAMMKNSAEAATGAAKKTAADKAEASTAGAAGKAKAASDQANEVKGKADAVHDNAQGLGNAVKGLGE